MKGATIYLSTASVAEIGKYFRFDNEFDGQELVITGVKNLKIVGQDKIPVKIITKPVYGDVLVFENCENNFEFNNCTFKENMEFDLVNITDCIGVKFDNCTFRDNKTGIESYSDYVQ